MMVAARVAALTPLNVIYIDTSASFSIKRIEQLFRFANQGKNIEDGLKQIKVFEIHNVFALNTLLETLKERIHKGQTSFYKGVRILIVDSLSSMITPHLGEKHYQGNE